MPPRRHAFALLAVFAAGIAHAGDAEPPARLQVKIGDARAVVETGKVAEVVVDGKPLKVLIEELPTRRFDAAGLRFDYPRNFSWEHDDETWTLDGSNAVVIITRGLLGGDAMAADVLDGIEDEIGAKTRGKREKVVLETSKGRIEGVAATVRVASTAIRNEAYVVGPGVRPVILLLQDTLDDAGRLSTEFTDMRRRLAATLEF